MRAVLYVPTGTGRTGGDRIATAALHHCHATGLVLVALAWTITNAIGLIADRHAEVVIAMRPTRDFDRAVRAAGGTVAALRPAPARQGGPLTATLAALVAAGRLDPDVADELLIASTPAETGDSPGRRPARLG